MGVEPTKDCTTALPGFEVRTSHPGARLFLFNTTKNAEDKLHPDQKFGIPDDALIFFSCFTLFGQDDQAPRKTNSIKRLE